MISTSPKFGLNSVDGWKIFRAGAISLLCYLLVAVGQWATATDFGAWNAVIVPMVIAATEAGRRWLTDYSADVPPTIPPKE
jgi:hypothetical protein